MHNNLEPKIRIHTCQSIYYLQLKGLRSYCHICPSPFVNVPDDIQLLLAVLACGIGHFHMAHASSRLAVQISAPEIAQNRFGIASSRTLPRQAGQLGALLNVCQRNGLTVLHRRGHLGTACPSAESTRREAETSFAERIASPRPTQGGVVPAGGEKDLCQCLGANVAQEEVGHGPQRGHIVSKAGATCQVRSKSRFPQLPTSNAAKLPEGDIGVKAVGLPFRQVLPKQRPA